MSRVSDALATLQLFVLIQTTTGSLAGTGPFIVDEYHMPNRHLKDYPRTEYRVVLVFMDTCAVGRCPHHRNTHHVVQLKLLKVDCL